jgi:hypothetical protein
VEDLNSRNPVTPLMRWWKRIDGLIAGIECANHLAAEV